MNKKEPFEIALRLLKQTKGALNDSFHFLTPDFGIVNSFVRLDTPLFNIEQPYRLKEGRIIFVLSGEVRISVNLVEYIAQAGDLLVISPGTIVQALGYTSDCDFQMIGADTQFIQLHRKEEFFEHYFNHPHNVLLKLTNKEWTQMQTYFNLMWDIVQEPPFRREVVQSLFSAMLYHIAYLRKDTQGRVVPPLSRQEEILRRFITLVNEHSKAERTVGFYANKLCLTPRYLNTVIRQASRQTVMDWINQAVTLEAQLLLKHSDLLVYQIADELNFANASFFCKFFKRMSGMTPQEYQKQ